MASVFLSAAVLCCLLSASHAKPARCSTTDEGSYPCELRMTAPDGSFEVSAPGKPTYILNIDGPNIAFGFVIIGRRTIPLPGRYLRSRTDPGCWVNDATRATICARE
jgi:hypothetical protein